jgi:hypothetical protein
MSGTRSEGKRGTGRQLRWGDSVDQNIRLQGGRNGMSLALNNEEWKKLLKMIRANTQGCEANDDDSDDHTPNLCILISYDQ